VTLLAAGAWRHIVGSPQIAIFFVLALTCLAAPRLLHLQGTTQRDRSCVVLTLIFLAWVLLFMVSLRSR
jgi:Ca2+/Na+ antiporter